MYVYINSHRRRLKLHFKKRPQMLTSFFITTTTAQSIINAAVWKRRLAETQFTAAMLRPLRCHQEGLSLELPRHAPFPLRFLPGCVALPPYMKFPNILHELHKYLRCDPYTVWRFQFSQQGHALFVWASTNPEFAIQFLEILFHAMLFGRCHVFTA